MDTLDQPYCSVAKIGRQWFWCTWRQYPYGDEAGDPVCGYEATEAAAQERAKAEALRMGADPTPYDGPLGYRRSWYHRGEWKYRRWHSSYARDWHKVLVARRRKPNETAAPVVQATEYVYHGRYPSPCAHRILKKTRARIYVEEDCHSYVSTWGGVACVSAFALDRAKLEAGEPVYRYREFMEFRLSPTAPELGDEDVPECFLVLGLKPPCTVQQVRKAFRRRSKEVHPDKGGSADDFRKLKDSYEEVMASLA